MTVAGPYEFSNYYIGVSSDTKPTNANVGDKFFESDTRIWYIWNDSEWVQEVQTASGPDVFETSTDPTSSSAVTQTIIDGYGGVLITLTATGNAQTMASPTVTTAGKQFTVINNDTSTHSIVVNGVTVAAGKAQSWLWDGSAWVQIDVGIIAVPVAVTQGGTGLTTITDHGLLLGSGTGAITPLAVATDGQIPIGSSGADPVLASITSGDGIDITNGAGSISVAVDLKANGGLVIETTELAVDLSASAITGTLAVGDGGTGVATIADGALMVGAATAAIEAVAVGVVGEVLIGAGAATNPVWLAPQTVASRKFLHETGTGTAGQNPTWEALQSGDIPNNAADTSGTATKATNLKGGNNTTLLGSIGYQSDTDTTTLLGPNVTTTRKFLRQSGDDTNGAAPAWDTVQAGDVPTLNQNTTGSAGKATNLTGGNDSTLLGSMPYQSNTDVTTLLGPNTTTTKKFLRQTGNGTNGAVPAWDTVLSGDVDYTTTPVAGTFTQVTIGGCIQWMYAASILDDGTVVLPTVTADCSGHGVIQVSASGIIDDSAEFELNSTGNVALIRATSNVVVNADTDNKLCIGTAAAQNPLTVKNRLDGTKKIMITFTYA